MKEIVKITLATASGQRVGWAKHVTKINEGQKGGYAYEGEFLRSGQAELPVGAVLIYINPEGSVAHQYQSAKVRRVLAGGELETVREFANFRTEEPTIRRFVAELLDITPNPLADYTDENLLAECRRRGLLS